MIKKKIVQHVKLPGPTMTIGESKALGNDIVPFFTQTGTRQSLFKGSREASHVEHRPRVLATCAGRKSCLPVHRDILRERNNFNNKCHYVLISNWKNK